MAITNARASMFEPFPPIRFPEDPIILAMASDRLRDCFISAVLKKTTKEYEAGKYNGQEADTARNPFLRGRPYMAKRRQTAPRVAAKS
jgi:hypothetical protein